VAHWQLKGVVPRGVRGVKYRPNFKISYFRPSKCRPCTVPSGAHAPFAPFPPPLWLAGTFRISTFASVVSGVNIVWPLHYHAGTAFLSHRMTYMYYWAGEIVSRDTYCRGWIDPYYLRWVCWENNIVPARFRNVRLVANFVWTPRCRSGCRLQQLRVNDCRCPTTCSCAGSIGVVREHLPATIEALDITTLSPPNHRRSNVVLVDATNS